jgi:hypothetical protein
MQIFNTCLNTYFRWNFDENALHHIFLGTKIVCLANNTSIDGRIGVVVGMLAYYARGRGFDPRTVQTFVCMNMSVVLGLGVLLCIMCIYLQKKVYKYVLVYLSVI